MIVSKRPTRSEISALRNIWRSMLNRCQNPKDSNFHNYGGRGITVCKDWQTFENFWDDMAPRPQGLSLDRIDNDKGYYEENCRWANRLIQANNRRNNHFLSLRGRRHTIAQWSRLTGISQSTLHIRLKKGWSIDEILITESQKIENLASNEARHDRIYFSPMDLFTNNQSRIRHFSDLLSDPPQIVF